MRYRGWITLCVLTCGLVAALAVSAVAQETKPAGPALAPVPTDATVPAAPPTPGVTTPAGDGNAPVDPNSKGGGKGNTNQPGPDMWLFGVLLGGVVLMWIWMGRGRRKQQAKRKEMLSNLKKGDKVTTIGGIIGTVIEVRPDEVTVKVDETNNVRMKFTRGAIHGVGADARASLDEDKK